MTTTTTTTTRPQTILLPLLLAACLTAMAALSFTVSGAEPEPARLRVLIVDGQNNHDWRTDTPNLKKILEATGRFAVDVSTTPPAGAKGDAAAEAWKNWRPKFADYAVVVTNYNGEPWPQPVREDFVRYVREGGGLVVVHAADNAFPDWPEYNEMIGLGGWGGRNEKSGPMVRWRDGAIVRDTQPGAGGTHGRQHEFVVETRAPEHPVMRGLPLRWKHATDELYAKMRGPAKNMTVLATAYSAPDTGGTGEHEPMLLAIDYGKGRVFHTLMGHGPRAMAGLGFQVTLARGTEWAATGKVTLPPPAEGELTADKAAVRPLR